MKTQPKRESSQQERREVAVLRVLRRTICHAVIVLGLIDVSLALAESAQSAAEILAEHGIDAADITTTLTPYRQKTGFKMGVEYTRDIEGTTAGVEYGRSHRGSSEPHKFYVLYNPYTNYGIDLRLEVREADLEKYSERGIRKKLDELMGLQLLLGSKQIYDKESLQIAESDGDNIVVSYRYLPEALPPRLKHYQYIAGFIYLSNGKLDRVELKNITPYEIGKVKVDRYRKTLYYSDQGESSDQKLDRFTVTLDGTENGQPFEDSIQGQVTERYEQSETTLPSRGGMQLRAPLIASDDGFETIFVDLDRPFPIWGKGARERGYDLPKPFGVSMVTLLQGTQFELTSFELDGVDVGNLIGGDDAKVENSALALLVRADMWLFPFMNVGVLLGESNTSTDITLQVLPNGSPGLPPLLPPIPPGDYFTVAGAKSSSSLYGLGVSLAGGEGNYFGLVDIQYLQSFTAAAETTMEITIVTASFGYNFQDIGTRLMVGGQYQDFVEEINATLMGSDGSAREVRVGAFTESWAALVGLDKGWSRNWNTSLLLTYGEDRKNLSLSIGYRF